MPRMSKTVSRIAALGLLAAVLALLVLGVAMPIAQRFQALAQAIEDQRLQLDQYGAVAAQGANLRTLEQQRQAEFALNEFVPGDSDLAAQANLQTTLIGLAQASGVRVRSARKLPERERAPFKLVGMGLNLTTDIANVQKVLYAIETARPYLFVEAVDISPLGGANPPPGQRMLEVRLDIFAAPQRKEQPDARPDILAAPQRREQPEGRPDIFATPPRREQP
jgi:general secretion pathway protein M